MKLKRQFSFAAPLSRRRTTALAAASALLLAAPTVLAQTTLDWKADAASTAWATGSNWVGEAAPANDLTTNIARFNQTIYAFAPNAGTTGIAGLIFGDGTTITAGFTLATAGGQGLTVGASGILMNANAGAVTVGNATTAGVKLGTSGQNWANDSSNLLTIRNLNTNGTNTVNFTGSGSGGTTISTLLTGAGTLNINTTGGTTALSNANTSFSGAITLTQGSLRLADNNALGTSTLTIFAGTIDVNGARTTTNNNAQNWDGDFTFVGSNTWNTGTGAVAMNANRQVTVTASTMTVGGAISGDGFGLTKEGAGTLVLAGANTYSGATQVNQGILSFQNTAAKATGLVTAAAAGAVGLGVGGTGFYSDTDVASLFNTTLDGFSLDAASGVAIDTTAGSFTQSTALTAARALTKLGANTLTLASANAYTGATTISAGILQLGNANAVQNSAVTVSVANSLAFSSGIGTFHLASLAGTGDMALTDIAAGNVTLVVGSNNSSTSYTGLVSGGGSIVKTGSGTFTFGKTGNSFTGGLTVLEGTVIGGATNNSTVYGTGTLTLGGTTGSANATLQTQQGTWTNAIVSQAGSSGTNTLILNGNANVIHGGTVLLDKTLVLNPGNDLGAFNFTNTISGAGGITKIGSSTGATILSGANTYTGTTTISAGVLRADVADGAGTGALGNGGLITFTGGTLRYTAPSAGTDWSSRFKNSTSVITLDTNGQNVTLAGIIDSSNTGGLTKLGAGNLTLSGANTFSGPVTISGGSTLLISAANHLGDGSATNTITTIGASTLESTSGTYDLGVNRSITMTTANSVIKTDAGELTVSGLISGAFRLRIFGNGTTILSNTGNSYTGSTTISDSTALGGNAILQVSSLANAGVASTLGAGASILMGVSNNTPTLRLFGSTSAQSTDRTIGISDANGGLGSATIANDNADANHTLTFTGAAFNVQTNAGVAKTLILAGTNTGHNAINGVIQNNTTDPVKVTKQGTGKWILAGANTYTGATAVNGGTLQAVNSAALATTTAVTVTNADSTLAVNFGGASDYSDPQLATLLAKTTFGAGTILAVDTTNGSGNFTGALSGAGGLTKLGAGTLTLSGTNTYTGATTVNAGSLAVNGSSIDNANKLVISGGTVDLTGAETVGTLFFGAVQQAAGTYSDDGVHFTGLGTLIVSSGPVGGYASWMAPFITGGLTGDTTATGDPDNDGMNNLLEYALNGNPGTSDPSILPDLVVTTTDFEFTYSRLDLSMADTTQTFEYGTTLTGWTPVVIPAGPGVSTVGIATVTVTDAGSTDTVKVSIPKSAFPGGKLFGRLQVVK